MARALLIIDIQRDYFAGGGYPLAEPDSAAQAAARVLGAFRESGEPVVHVKHVWDEPEATYMVPGTEGAEIHPTVAPHPGERVIEKEEPNAFLGTGLESELRSIGADELVIAGMESGMCVDSTVRAASDLGFEVTLVHDACAASDAEFGGVSVPGPIAHAAFMAALADGYADLVGSEELSAG